MAKKWFLSLILAVFIVGGVSAQIQTPEFRISIGGGLYFTNDFGGGVQVSPLGFQLFSMDTPYAGGGFFFFFDATFVELSLGIFGGIGRWRIVDNIIAMETVRGDVSVGGIDIGLLGRYPFAVSPRITVFPLVGIRYRAVVLVEDDYDEWEDPGDFSALWFQFGGGLDNHFNDNFFLRLTLLYGIRLRNQLERDFVDVLNADTHLGHGLEIRVGLGWRF